MNTRQRTEIVAVKVLGDLIGYGHLMHIASALWRKSLVEKHNLPPDGAFIATSDDFITDEKAMAEIQKSIQLYDNLIHNCFHE